MIVKIFIKEYFIIIIVITILIDSKKKAGWDKITIYPYYHY